MDCDNYNRRLLTAGRATFEFLNALDGVEEELETVADAFSKLNYEHAGKVLDPDRATFEQLIQGLTAQSTEQDLLVIYYTGHADSTDRFYLLASDSRPEAVSFGQQAIPVEELTRLLIGAKASQILLILDVCHAGLGALESVNVSLRFAEKQNIFPQLYILASAMPRDVADERVFSSALAFTLSNPNCRFGGMNQRYMAMDDVIHGISQYFAAHFPMQEPLLYSVNQQQRCMLFPNPRYNSRLSAGMDLASQNAFEQHWLPKAKGGEQGINGSYFTGRQAALTTICEWLEQPVAKPSVLVVTGGAGTGKSALLARLVTLADERYSSAVASVSGYGSPNEPRPRSGVFDAVVHARSKYLDDVVGEISQAFSLVTNDVDYLLATLRDSKRSLTIVIDALDESPEAEPITQRLLMPMSQFENVSLLLGTRPDSVGGARRFQGMGSETLEIDLNSPVHTEQDQVARYVCRRLMASEEPGKYSPYRDHEELAQEVGEAVARRAGHVFLVAHTAVLSLLLRSGRVDTSEPGWENALPDGLGNAFNQFLSSLDNSNNDTCSRGIVEPTLRALAFAQGEGLPWAELWSLVASALSGTPVSDANIIDVRRYAAPFIVEAVEDERSVYRLYHEQLAEFLRDDPDNQRVCHERMWDALLASVPVERQGKPQWQLAHPHFKRHLASYASKAGRLDDVLGDPGLMLTSDPTGLRRYLTLGRGRDYPLVDTYLSIFGTLRDLPEHERYGPFAVALLQRSLKEQAQQLEPQERGSWMPAWTYSRRPEVSQVLARRDSPVTTLEVGEWQGEAPIALIGRSDGLIEVIRLDNGMLLATWHPFVGTPIDKLATAVTEEGQVLVAAVRGGVLGAVNLRTGKQWFVSPPEGAVEQIGALALIQGDGGLICATAHHSDASPWNAIRVWAVQDFVLKRQCQKASRSHINSLAFFPSTQGLRLLSGGNIRVNGQLVAPALRLWNAELEQIWHSPEELKVDVVSLRLHQVQSRYYAVMHAFADKSFIWLCLDSWLEEVYRPSCSYEGLWAETTEEGLLLHIRNYHEVRSHLLKLGEPKGESLTVGPVKNWGEFSKQWNWSRAIRIETRSYVLSSSAGAVLMWPLPEAGNDEAVCEQLYPFEEELRCAVVGPGASPILYCAIDGGQVVALDMLTGEETRRWKINGSRLINALSGYSDGERYRLVIADNQRIWQIDTETIEAPVKIGEIDRKAGLLEVVRHDGQVLIFAAMDEGHVNAVRIFDARSGQEVDTRMQDGHWSYQLQFGEEDKPINSLSCMAYGDEVRLAFASKYSKIMVAEHSGMPRPSRHLYQFRTLYIRGSEIARVNAITQCKRHQLIAAGTEFGAIAVWRFASDDPIARKSPTHAADNIIALAFCEDSEVVLLASGSENGALRFWDVELRMLRQIELGAPVRMLRFLGLSRLLVITRDSATLIQLDGTQEAGDA